MNRSLAPEPSRSWWSYWPVGFFATALAISISITTRNLDTGFLAGHEFRQAQTALSILFIEKEQDYSLAYPTPLFGPPWSIPMEFPLYQWASAVLVHRFGWSVPFAGRVVGLLCFYLTLPALGMLLLRTRMPRPGVWISLGLILLAPVYLFYTRAVMIESTALMAGCWFLLSFTQLCRRKTWFWATITGVLGAIAALTKVTTFMVWGLAALWLGARLTWKVKQQRGNRAALSWLSKIATAGTIPLVAGSWWVHYTDKIKSLSTAGQQLTSGNVREFTMGSWEDRTSWDVWSQLGYHFSSAVFSGWALVVLPLFFLVPELRRRSWAILLLSGWALVIWMIFPGLYQIHDYYFYAMAVIPLAALGWGIGNLTQHHVLRWSAPVLLGIVAGLQLANYTRTYAAPHAVISSGGHPIHHFLRAALHQEDVIVVLGTDWSATTALYSKRRCMMISDTMLRNLYHFERWIDQWQNEPIAGLLVTNRIPIHDSVIEILQQRLGLDKVPVIESDSSEFFAVPSRRNILTDHITLHPNNHAGVRGVSAALLEPNSDPTVGDGEIHSISENQSASLFSLVSPRPDEYRAKYGFAILSSPYGLVLAAHPDTDFWLNPQVGATRIELKFGMNDNAYADDRDRSTGTVFQVWGSREGESEQLIWERTIDPWNTEADRGILSDWISLPNPTPDRLRFSTRPGETYAFDSAFWGRVKVW